jgi:hypothetical protein
MAFIIFNFAVFCEQHQLYSQCSCLSFGQLQMIKQAAVGVGIKLWIPLRNLYASQSVCTTPEASLSQSILVL